jgi:hypothetical protein
LPPCCGANMVGCCVLAQMLLRHAMYLNQADFE